MTKYCTGPSQRGPKPRQLLGSPSLACVDKVATHSLSSMERNAVERNGKVRSSTHLNSTEPWRSSIDQLQIYPLTFAAPEAFPAFGGVKHGTVMVLSPETLSFLAPSISMPSRWSFVDGGPLQSAGLETSTTTEVGVLWSALEPLECPALD